MTVVLFLSTLLDDRPQAGLQRATIPPNVFAVALRLPFVKKGMTQADVARILGVDDYLLRCLSYGTLHTCILSYTIRPGYQLTEVYGLDLKGHGYVLEEATLSRVSTPRPEKK
jgi:hypothetical protein